MVIVILGLLLASQTPDSAARAVPADSYADSATAALVARARAARERNERLVTAYTATVKQRIGVGIRALSRDRMLYRQELVARISWKRDAPSTVELIGAREGIPVVYRGDQIPEELEEQARSLVINPAQDYLRLTGSDDDGLVYPLRDGGEADYRFAAGDTLTITLPTGERFRLASLEVTPRRSEWRLIAGTFWFDADTHGLVQAVFRPARPFEFRRDVDPEDREDVPGFVNPTAEVKFVTLEYGLYEARWWMPRYLAVDAAGTMGSWLGVPVRMERIYEDYVVEGGTPPPPGSTFRPAGTIRPHERDSSVADPEEERRIGDSIATAIQECVQHATRDHEGESRRAVRARVRACTRRERDSNLVVTIPADTIELLSSPELGPPILAMGDLITEDEIRGLADAIKGLPSASRRWAPRVQLPRGITALLQHARYNRIEALSLGLSGSLDLGPLVVRGTGRLGLADRVPNAELSLVRLSPNARFALTGYRRLSAANPDTRPFGPINSFLGVVAQRDDGEYYRTLGGELVAENTNSGWWSARLFVQRERPATVETSASLPRLFDRTNTFRPNILADRADQVGASVTFRGTRAVSPTITLGGEMTVGGAAGDYDHARGAATVRLFVTPAGPLAGAVTASAGTSTGDVPVQSRFYLGGAGTLRGYPGGVAAGTAYWTGRVEVGNSFPAIRVIGFTDVGWAGDRGAFGRDRTLIGAGVGASFLDGLVRLDLARGLRAPTGWRLEFYLDGVL
jgi:hypothetical protein